MSKSEQPAPAETSIARTAPGLDRRRFVQLAGGALALGFSSRLGAATLAGSRWFSDVRDNRVLVVIHLKGGNDGLNTVVPVEADDYHRLRPTLALPHGQLCRIDERLWLNAAAAPLQALYDAGQLAIVNQVGSARPSLSHYRASEIWHTASEPEQVLATGWLGRSLLAGNFKAYSDDGYVRTDAHRALFAEDAGELRHFGLPESGTSVAGAQFASAAAVANDFAQRLTNIAMSLQAKSGVRIVHVTLDGFDTHFSQAGQHEALLQAYATGLVAFHRQLKRLGVTDRVVTLTFSEFGRSVAENTAGGTDHGTTGPVFVTGAPVRGGSYGAGFSQGNLAGSMTDFRCVYATVIERWLGASTKSVLGRHFEPLGFLPVV